jgi:hypothetical protein
VSGLKSETGTSQLRSRNFKHYAELCIIRSFHCAETEVVFFPITAPCSLAVENQRFGGRAASVFRFNVRNQGAVSTARSNSPANHDSCFSAMKTKNYVSGTCMGRQQCTTHCAQFQDGCYPQCENVCPIRKGIKEPVSVKFLNNFGLLLLLHHHHHHHHHHPVIVAKIC